MDNEIATKGRPPWSKGKLVGQKAPFKPKEIWVGHVRLSFYRHQARGLRFEP